MGPDSGGRPDGEPGMAVANALCQRGSRCVTAAPRVADDGSVLSAAVTSVWRFVIGLVQGGSLLAFCI